MSCPPCDEVVPLAHLAVLRALELVGRRMIPRSEKRNAPDVPAYEMHTELVAEAAELDKLMRGAWDMLAVAMPDRPDLVAALDAYTRTTVFEGRPHTLAAMRDHLETARVIEGG